MSIIGFLDRDKVLHGKTIQGVTIYGYHEIPDLAPDVILVTCPKQHRTDIVQMISKNMSPDTCIFLLDIA